MREDQLIQRMGQGDAGAAEELAALYYPQILRYCIWHVPVHSMAEDAAQETFLKALRYFDKYDHRGHFKAYIYRIAANVCIDMGRKRSITDEPLDDGGSIESMQLVKDDLKAAETKIAMEQMLQILPPRLREIIYLRFFHDLSLKEISRILDIPLRTAQSQLRTALKILEKTYRKGDFL